MRTEMVLGWKCIVLLPLHIPVPPPVLPISVRRQIVLWEMQGIAVLIYK